MSWAFDPSNWAATSHAPTYADFVNIYDDIHAWGGDVVAGGNYLRTCGAVQLQAGDVPGTSYSITAASWSGSTATYTIGTHHVVVGQLVTVASVTPSGYNVSLVPVTAVTGTTVSVALASNPGAYTSGGTLTVGQAPQNGMIAVDGAGVLKRYFGGWASITAASQTPWAQAIDGGGFALSNVASIVLNPAAVPTGAAGKLAVNGSNKLQVYDGSAWQYPGLQDPGSNGLVKRTALNTSTAAAAGTDYYAPGGTIARADLPAMVASGSSHAAGIVPDPGSVAGTTKFLREDGSWAIPAAAGLADPGSNGLVKRTASNTTAPAVVNVDYYAPGNLISISDIPTMIASGGGHAGGLVPDPGSVAGSGKFLCENGSWATPTITAIQGRAVSASAPTDGQVIAWSTANNQWQPTAPGGAGANATQLQGYNVSTTAPTNNYVLTWNSGASEWQPTAAPGGSQTPWTSVIDAAGYNLKLAGAVGVGIDPAFPIHVSQSGVQGIVCLESFGTGSMPRYIGRFARGTKASPTAVQLGDVMLTFVGEGYGATGWSGVSGYVLQAAQNFTDTAQGTYAAIYTTPNGSTASQERVRIDQDGSIGIGGISYGGGGLVMFIANCTTVPTTNPTGGGILYVQSGALKYRGSSGTVTPLALA